MTHNHLLIAYRRNLKTHTLFETVYHLLLVGKSLLELFGLVKHDSRIVRKTALFLVGRLS